MQLKFHLKVDRDKNKQKLKQTNKLLIQQRKKEKSVLLCVKYEKIQNTH